MRYSEVTFFVTFRQLQLSQLIGGYASSCRVLVLTTATLCRVSQLLDALADGLLLWPARAPHASTSCRGNVAKYAGSVLRGHGSINARRPSPAPFQ
jgi:hypothetical protein